MTKNTSKLLATLLLIALFVEGALVKNASCQDRATNPVIWADVPDVSVLRVGDDYYMSSTTMHMSPGVPIMKSRNLVDWELIGYAYDVLEDVDALALRNGASAYGAGSWASSLRYRDGVFYLATFSSTTGKTHIYSTRDPSGKWEARSFRPACHDCSLFFDDDGKAYLVFGSSNIRIRELRDDLAGFKEGGLDAILVENAERVAGGRRGLPAEGSQFFKKDGKYYLCNITWPQGGMRTETLYCSDNLTGPYEGRVIFKDRGIAQGTLFDSPTGEWYAMLFQDAGAVGRMPYLIPVRWDGDFPTLGIDERAPATLDIVRERAPMGNIVESDDFTREGDEDARRLPPAWQWNHNPDAEHWSLSERPGWLRLTISRKDANLTSARNTLTQRVFGPTCAGTTALDVGGLQEGDVVGLCLLQRKYGYVGVTKRNGRVYVVQAEAETARQGGPNEDALRENELTSLDPDVKVVYFKATCDFRDRRDVASFYWSVDGTTWRSIGGELKMVYTLPHFMGYRFGLFAQGTESSGGFADFDFFKIDEK